MISQSGQPMAIGARAILAGSRTPGPIHTRDEERDVVKRKGPRKVSTGKGPGEKLRMGLSSLLEATIRAKCDPDVFLFLTGVYQAAAQRQMPIMGAPFRAPDEPGEWLVLNDIPLNRGMLAVVGELRSMKLTGNEPLMHAYMYRLMHLGDVWEARERLAEFITAGDEPGASMVSEALIKAVALADIIKDGDQTSLDIDSVLSHARRLASEEEADDEGKQ